MLEDQVVAGRHDEAVQKCGSDQTTQHDDGQRREEFAQVNLWQQPPPLLFPLANTVITTAKLGAIS